ncbi:MAG: hypothetical protein EOM12_05325 [Verrucomicrobiae bacterium]|nr:hypothetical protein [Verrucomicrobiae bacterium]
MSAKYTTSGMVCFVIGCILIVWGLVFFQATARQRELAAQVITEREVLLGELGLSADEAAKVDEMAREDPEIATQSLVIGVHWNELMASVKAYWTTMQPAKKAVMTASSYIFTLRRPEYVLGKRAFTPGVMIIAFVFIMGFMIIKPVQKR